MVEGHSIEHFRLFIAIAVPDFIKVKLATTQDRLAACLDRRSVRWTKPDQFHLTLRFLGRVEPGLLGQLIDALLPVGRAVPPLALRARGVGFFPTAKSPRVIWVGIQGAEERLMGLHQAVQRATLKFTNEKAEERFRGHITLGRTKQLSRNEATTLARTAERFSETTFGEWTVDELHLMRSELWAAGAIHTVLTAVRLAGE